MASVRRVVHDFSLRAMGALCFAIYILMILFLAVSIPESPFLVALGFLPVLLYLVAIFTLLQMGKSVVELVYLLPLVLVFLYYLVWTFNLVPEMGPMDGGVLSVLNLIISYVFAMILSFVHPVSKRHPIRGKKAVAEAFESEETLPVIHPEVEHDVPALDEQEVKTTIRAIEDKCKAINFVIGRVYSNKKGGSKALREKIVVPRELYNAFSELTDDDEGGSYDKLKLLSVVENIYARLKRLTHPEKELFVINEGKLPVERAKDGSDTVLDVLARNDKDPVEDYHKAAIGVCEQVVDWLRQNS